MKLCDRCCVPGCCLNYLGTACENARREECPDVQPNRAELIAAMSLDEMAERLISMFEEICEDGVPAPDYMRSWLAGTPEEGEELW